MYPMVWQGKAVTPYDVFVLLSESLGFLKQLVYTRQVIGHMAERIFKNQEVHFLFFFKFSIFMQMMSHYMTQNNWPLMRTSDTKLCKWN